MNIIFLADNHIIYINICRFPSAAAIFMLKKFSVGPIVFTKPHFQSTVCKTLASENVTLKESMIK